MPRAPPLFVAESDHVPRGALSGDRPISRPMPPASGGFVVSRQPYVLAVLLGPAQGSSRRRPAALSVVWWTIRRMTALEPRTEIRRLRLAAQWIDASGPVTPDEVVRSMLAMQAQDLPGAKWSVGLRTPGYTLADVDKAFNDRKIVRSWPMRGTLHLVPAEDLGWMLGLTAARTVQSQAARHRQLGINDAAVGQAADVSAAIIGQLGGATRAELFTAFEQAGISTAGQRGVHLLGRLCQMQLLCQGPVQRDEQLFVLLDEWVPRPRRLETEEALGEFVLRYFTGHGPATLADFCRWTKLPLGAARTGLTRARSDLEKLEIGDRTLWMRVGLRESAPQTVHLLPGFDEMILGYADRSATLPAEYAGAVVPGNNGVFQPTVVVDGRVVGIWRRRRTKPGVTVTPSLFRSLSVRERSALDDAANDYARFLGVPVVLN